MDQLMGSAFLDDQFDREMIAWFQSFSGHFCEEGTGFFQTSPCDNGTYSNYTGNSAEGDCQPCDPGFVCNGRGLSEPNGVCAAGYFCRGGAQTDRPNDAGATGAPCTAGHYCPEGTGIKRSKCEESKNIVSFWEAGRYFTQKSTMAPSDAQLSLMFTGSVSQT